MTALGDLARANGVSDKQKWDDIGASIDALPTNGNPPVDTVIDVAPADGTPFGDITGDAGLSRLFSGATTGNTNGGAASKKLSATSGYAGKAFSTPKRIDHIKVYGTSDVGLWHTGNPQVTVSVYAKMGVQSS